ncbi:MAG TPA: hypothetical protein VEN81_16575 [Planctomycetota bacterium]|nr:hypothetical protein [Planctomycetota bacterium]
MIDSPLVRPPRPQAVRMAAWAPARVRPAPRARAKLGSFLGIPIPTIDETTIVSAGLGGAAIFLSDAFDPPVNLIVKVGGFVAVGYAAYHLFGGGGGSDGVNSAVKPLPPGTGAAAAAADAAQVAAARQAAQAASGNPPALEGDPSQVSGVIQDPANGGQLGPDEYSRFWTNTDYTVKLQLVNYSPGEVTVPLEYRVAYYYPSALNTQFRSTRWTVTVPGRYGDQAGTLNVSEKIKIDYDPSATYAAATLYINDHPISPTVRYKL